MQELQRLLEKIELLRERLVTLAREKGMAHPSVLNVSELLDVELNKYYKLRQKD